MCTADAWIIGYFPRAVMEKPLFFGTGSGKLDRCWLHDEEAPDYYEKGLGARRCYEELFPQHQRQFLNQELG